MQTFVIPQTAVVPRAELEVTEDLVLATPHIRRATPEFAHEYGGPLVEAFLEMADASGELNNDSLFMCQPTDFVDGAYPKAPRWHFDFPQGIPTTTDEDFKEGVFGCTGLIACMFEVERHPDDVGTLFVQGGDIELDLDLRDRQREYVPKQSIAADADSGSMYWWHSQVEAQIQSGEGAHGVFLLPNTLYGYGSNNLHMAPKMYSSTGRRVLMRVNTPTGSRTAPKAENLLIDPDDPSRPRYVFYADGDGWRREAVLV